MPVNPAASKSNLPHWIRNLLLTLAALLMVLAVTVVGTIGLLKFGPNLLATPTEKIVSLVLQRELQIGTIHELELGRDLYLLATDVRLENPDWSAEPDFVRVDHLRLKLQLSSLWQQGPIVLNMLELTDISVDLQAPGSHPPNWEFWPEEGQSTEPQSSDAEDEGMFPVVILDGKIASGRLRYRDGTRDVTALLDDVALSEQASSAMIELELQGTLNDIPLSVRGSLGPTGWLLTHRNLKMDFALQLGKLTLTSRGAIDDLSTLSGVDLYLQASAPGSRRVLDLLGLQELSDGALSFEGSVESASKGLVVDVVGGMGKFRLTLEGQIASPRRFDEFDLDYHLAGPSLAEVGLAGGVLGLPEAPFSLYGGVYRSGSLLGLREGVFTAGAGKLTFDGELPEFPEIDDWRFSLEGGEFDLAMIGPLIGAPDLPSVPYELKATLRSSAAGREIVDLRINSEDTELALSGIVGEAPSYLGSEIAVSIQGRSLAASGLWLNVKDLPELAFSVSGDVSLKDSGWMFEEGRFSTVGLDLGLEGALSGLSPPQQLTARLTLDTPDMAELLHSYDIGVDGLPGFPLTATALLSGTPDELRLDEATILAVDSRLELSGTLSGPENTRSLDFNTQFSSPDLLKIFPDQEMATSAKLPAKTHASLTLKSGLLTVKQLEGQLGSANFSVEGELNLADITSGSSAIIHADGPDLRAVTRFFLEEGLVPASPFRVSVDANFADGGLQAKRVKANVGDTELDAIVSIDKLKELSGARGKIAVSGPSSLNLFRMFDIDSRIPDAPFDLNIDLAEEPDGLHLNPVALNWGRSDYAGVVNIKTGEIPQITADIHSSRVSLPFLLPDIDELEEEDKKATAGVSQSSESELNRAVPLTQKELSERVIPDEKLDFAWLSSVEADIKYRADELFMRGDATMNLSLDVGLHAGVLQTRELVWDGTFSAGSAEVYLKRLEQGASAELFLDLQRVPVLLLLGGESDNAPGSYYRADLKAEGDSLRALAGSLNGALLFKGGGGRMDNKGIDLILGDTLEEIMNRINPFAETDTHTGVVCHAGGATVRDGQVSVDPGMVIRGDKLDIAAGGGIDLRKERLNLVFNSRSRKGLGVSASKAITPYFKLGGTLAKPRAALDVKGAAVSGGAAVATAGLSIVAEGLWDRWVATSKNPCEKLITNLSTKKKRNTDPLLNSLLPTEG